MLYVMYCALPLRSWVLSAVTIKWWTNDHNMLFDRNSCSVHVQMLCMYEGSR